LCDQAPTSRIRNWPYVATSESLQVQPKRILTGLDQSPTCSGAATTATQFFSSGSCHGGRRIPRV
jgi:hypothetical protein